MYEETAKALITARAALDDAESRWRQKKEEVWNLHAEVFEERTKSEQYRRDLEALIAKSSERARGMS